MMDGSAPAVALHAIGKSFGAVVANRDVDLTVARGTIHGIVGENGAGKTTLMNILYGSLQPDRGTSSTAAFSPIAGRSALPAFSSACAARPTPSPAASAWCTSISC